MADGNGPWSRARGLGCAKFKAPHTWDDSGCPDGRDIQVRPSGCPESSRVCSEIVAFPGYDPSGHTYLHVEHL